MSEMEFEITNVESARIPPQPHEFNDNIITKLSWKGDGGYLTHGAGSNFFTELDGTCVEAEFQASKHENPIKRKLLVKQWAVRRGGWAKKHGRQLPLRADWEDVKFDVMLKLVMQKFDDDPVLKLWLLSTGNRKIVEGNYWHDNTWGTCHCGQCANVEGKNWLGKILMIVRQDIRGPWIKGDENPHIMGQVRF